MKKEEMVGFIPNSSFFILHLKKENAETGILFFYLSLRWIRWIHPEHSG